MALSLSSSLGSENARGSLSLLVIALVATVFLLFPEQSVFRLADLSQQIIARFGLAFIVIPSLLGLVALGLSLSPWGKLKLGGIHATPEFGFLTWLAMLFAAGMGSGLIFWGVAEPVFHLDNPPPFVQHSGNPKDTALALTYFHWGLHAWAVYALAGLAMAWFAFNRGRPMQIAASFSTGRQHKGLYLLDLLAVMAIVFGVAGTFANTIALVQTGTEQISGLAFDPWHFRVGLVLLIATLFTLSSLTGLHRGIKLLSQFNALLMVVLLSLVVLLDTPWAVLTRLFSSTASYLALLPEVSFHIDPASAQWSQGWSVIYLVWWIAWAPFVGPFIARISRGRSVRQFLLCTIALPTLASMIWFCGFSAGLFERPELAGVTSAVNGDYTQGLFSYLALLPAGAWLAVAALLLLVTFVITSADSALLVTGMLTGQTGKGVRLLWSILLVALTLALVHINNVDLNKQIAILGALPFTAVLVAQVFALLRDLVRHGPSPSQ